LAVQSSQFDHDHPPGPDSTKAKHIALSNFIDKNDLTISKKLILHQDSKASLLATFLHTSELQQLELTEDGVKNDPLDQYCRNGNQEWKNRSDLARCWAVLFIALRIL
jgi:rhodanese-related sulfurtransferase